MQSYHERQSHAPLPCPALSPPPATQYTHSPCPPRDPPAGTLGMSSTGLTERTLAHRAWSFANVGAATNLAGAGGGLLSCCC